MMDPALWNASAGISNPLPVSGNLVYYFPEGHAEHAYITPDFILSSHVHQIPAPMFLCRVAAVHLSAHHISDEVFAKFTLDPLSASSAKDTPAGAAQPRLQLPDGFASHAKVLTASDAGNGSALTIPCRCAYDILPKLDYKLNPPAHVLTFFDAHGKAWEFKYIYRGNPRRHLMTTGWSSFVDSKMLVQGDTIVFIRGPGGRLFIRIRRGCTNPPNCFLSPHEVESAGEEGCFTRRTLCRISHKSVVEAANMAAAGRPFEVIYYPNEGLPEFVMAKELVDKSKKVKWASGMRVKMMDGVENSISSTGRTYHGTVSFAGFRQENGRLPPSIWRLLEIEWDDDREMMQNPKKRKSVNPWQVESVTTTPFYPVFKRFKVGEGSALKAPHGEGCSATTTSKCEAKSSLVQISSAGFTTQNEIHIGSDSDSTASEIINPAKGPQKTFKLFGNIIHSDVRKEI